MKVNLQAVFSSVDGEVNAFNGSGELCTFIRLRGCNLRCSMCDTKYSQEEIPTNLVEIDDILKNNTILNKVTITGGEPLLQHDAVVELCNRLLENPERRISIETNGSIKPDQLSFYKMGIGKVRFVVDYKLPSSGMESKMNKEVFVHLSQRDVIKFVISDYNDYYVARGLVVGNTDWKARKVFSPAIYDQKDYTGWPASLAQMMIDDAQILKDVQYSLQIHKVLFPYAKTER